MRKLILSLSVLTLTMIACSSSDDRITYENELTLDGSRLEVSKNTSTVNNIYTVKKQQGTSTHQQFFLLNNGPDGTSDTLYLKVGFPQRLNGTYKFYNGAVRGHYSINGDRRLFTNGTAAFKNLGGGIYLVSLATYYQMDGSEKQYAVAGYFKGEFREVNN